MDECGVHLQSCGLPPKHPLVPSSATAQIVVLTLPSTVRDGCRSCGCCPSRRADERGCAASKWNGPPRVPVIGGPALCEVHLAPAEGVRDPSRSHATGAPFGGGAGPNAASGRPGLRMSHAIWTTCYATPRPSLAPAGPSRQERPSTDPRAYARDVSASAERCESEASSPSSCGTPTSSSAYSCMDHGAPQVPRSMLVSCMHPGGERKARPCFRGRESSQLACGAAASCINGRAP